MSLKIHRFHVVRRLDISKRNKILIKISSILTAFVLCGLICTLFSPGTFIKFFSEIFNASFQTPKKIVFLFEEFALLLGISMALLPLFKMKYWNLGAEGQVLMGGFGAGIISRFVGPHIPNFVCLPLMIIVGVSCACLWSLIPAIFKSKFNTNETLFTLMFNYIAMGIVSFFIQMWDPAHGLMNGLTHGMLPKIFNQPYIITIISVFIIWVLVIIYIKKTIHGYEISVVGDSRNTAAYIGLDIKKVTLRTAVLGGAICGLVGFFLVGYSGSVSSNLANGRGFTSVLIVWLGNFNPFEIGLVSFLVAFMTRGASNAQTMFNLGSSFPKVCLGVYFIVILTGEFFVNYKFVKNEESVKQIKKEETING